MLTCIILALFTSIICTGVLNALKALLGGNLFFKFMGFSLFIGSTLGCYWMLYGTVASYITFTYISMTESGANTLATVFLISYLVDFFVIEIISLTVKIMFFSDIEKKVKDKDSPTFYHLLYFFMAVCFR